MEKFKTDGEMATSSTLSFTEEVSEPVLSKVTGLDEDSTSNSGSDVSDDEGMLGLGSDEEMDGGMDDDVNSNDEDDEMDQNGVKKVDGNPAWADAMAKILKTNKPKGKKSIVLSKAKKLVDVILKDKTSGPSFEIVGEVKDEKPDPSALDVKPKVDKKSSESRIKKLEWYSKGRQKPNILEKDRERILGKIGTKGVVQLFNVVRQQQKVIDSKLQDAGSGPAKREKILRTIDKRAFLDIVMGAVQSQSVDLPDKLKKEPRPEKVKEEDDSKPVSWGVLRDDFMMGGKYKDWDRDEPKSAVDDAEPMMDDSDTDSD